MKPLRDNGSATTRPKVTSMSVQEDIKQGFPVLSYAYIAKKHNISIEHVLREHRKIVNNRFILRQSLKEHV